jgi:hypothetical protein
MKALQASCLNDEWKAEGAHCYMSPALNQSHLEQIALFEDEISNGFIETTVTPLAGLPDEYPRGRIETTILFRYTHHGACYCAGLGAYGKKYFIARVSKLHENRQTLELLTAGGEGSSLKFNTPYRLRVEFMGSQITLFEKGVQQLSVEDPTYKVGRWGLRTFKTKARFASISAASERPSCFVVMPFSRKLDRAHRVIRETVKECGLNSVRGDQSRKSRPIMEEVRAAIAEANLIVVDLTGKNPNVYFEAGIADALKKPWILLAQSKDDLTFDISPIRTIFYSATVKGYEKLNRELAQAIRETMGLKPTPAKPRNRD